MAMVPPQCGFRTAFYATFEPQKANMGCFSASIALPAPQLRRAFTNSCYDLRTVRRAQPWAQYFALHFAALTTAQGGNLIKQLNHLLGILRTSVPELQSAGNYACSALGVLALRERYTQKRANLHYIGIWCCELPT
ncbi:hypothetical protein X739_11705 [Mesorhizobium sp. LNHC220B00]|nr:hypothetical protein [Mesorhizobium sp. LNHC220B00]ESY86386.1 hypothetical protein X739_11705 [Mesorhizobium sp. LNHC220B00]